MAVAAAPAHAKPPLEAFSATPEIRSMELSPDGSKVAFLAVKGDVEQVMLYDLATKKQEALATTGDFKARAIDFDNDGYVILAASKTTAPKFHYQYTVGKFEDTSAFAINVKSKRSVQLLTKTPRLFPAQSGLHQIAGYDPGGAHVFMPAYVTDGQLSSAPSFDLLKVSLATGVGVAAGGRSGTPNTRDWLVNKVGKVVAREDYDPKTGAYAIYAYDNDTARPIFRATDMEQPLSIVALDASQTSLIIATREESEFFTLSRMSLADGAITESLFQRDDADVGNVLLDRDGSLAGVGYSGMYPEYAMFDKALEADIQGIQAKLPGSAVRIDSWSDDWSRLLVHISGGVLPERYALFDRTARKLDLVAATRPAIGPDDIGEMVTIEYLAEDGLAIPGLITWPTGVAAADRKNLPMIVMPHGGPETYNAVGFDWMAQFFANEGYLVFQPNFRGSGGFGKSFAEAGHRQWGRKMQSDVTDGAKAMAAMGWADASRTCIVGGSYGGYAALAGGAMTPDQYKCVVAIAGVSDLRAMLAYERRDHGAKSLAYRYWTKVIGDPDADRAAIEAVSPVNLAASFKAPVLLIHGTDDLIVERRQSELMESALRKAGKDVSYIKLQGDDHYLSLTDNRQLALKTMRDFIAQHTAR